METRKHRRARAVAMVAAFAGALPLSASSQDGTALESIEIQVGEMVFDAFASGPADGELVLLLHGFPQSGFAFRHQLTTLGRAGFRAVAPNQRGYSPRARPTSATDYGMTALVSDALGMATALGHPEFHLVGHDWGAAVAWVAAATAPARVISLTALSTPHVSAFSQALADPNSEQAAASSYMEGFRAEGAERAFLADDAASFRELIAGFAKTPEEVAHYLDVLGTEEALGAALNWYRAMGAGTSGASSPLIVRVPTLYVWSTNDAAFARSAAEASADFVAGPYRFEVLEGVSHWIPEEAPGRLGELLLEHLSARRR